MILAMNKATPVPFILVLLLSISLIGGGPLLAASPASKPASTGDLVHDHGSSLVIVRSEAGAGTGFVCKNGEAAFLYTNIHVVVDLQRPTFTRLDGAVVVTGVADLSAGRDIARFEVKNPPANPLEVSTDFNDSVRIGDDVIVLGNSGGGGVVTGIKGAIVGIGPDRIEVSAPFIPGNSGSPIIHVKTGKVIGIATYLTMRREDPTKSANVAVRHFGYRIDNASTWEHVDWIAFQQDLDGVKQVAALTTDIFNFLRALQAKRSPNFATETLRKPAEEWMKALRNRQLTVNGRRTVTANFLRALQQMAASDVLILEPRLHYTCFRGEMHVLHEIRQRLYDGFSKESQQLSAK